MMRMVMAVLALMTLAVPAGAREVSARVPVLAALQASADAWNRGDLDGFLSVYSDGAGTTFTGKNGVVRGKAAIRKRYILSYSAVFGPNAKGRPQRLWFTPKDFRMLGNAHALLIAQWHLDARNGVPALSGMTSLVFAHEKAGWKIIADHSD
ncbi:DUF4440 domain-containing protein [Stakelama sediminis]|uniref:Ketosteroid isomerase-like protein n=1 Tax=Stakelama sediminis TaxID=463200 RepID=A0A840Z3Q7_9SPHN|nr:DUF4440 domain-containing protein [Stakelama sediminis]MBB5720272.1 ketosteroid isomerase-like protein [Stakelama sediminis]